MDAAPAPGPGTVAPLSGTEAALIGLAALAVVIIPFLWLCAAKLIENGRGGRPVSLDSGWSRRR